MQDLGTLGGPNSKSRGINNRGEIVGYSLIAGNYHAFLFSHGQMLDLGTLGGPTSQAFGINDRGQIVGVSFSNSGTNHAFLFVAA